MTDKPANFQIIICGRGGQGVLFLTRLLDQAAVLAGSNVLSSEVHGMAMRGGSVASHVKIGSFSSPLIRSGTADYMIAISAFEYDICSHILNHKKNHAVINKASGTDLSRSDKNRFYVDADAVAKQSGAAVLSNIVLAGFACADPFFRFDYDTVVQAVKMIGSAKMMDRSLNALDEGHRLGQKFKNSFDF